MDIQPFKALRPTKDKVHLVVSRPINAYKKSILKDKLKHNPFSFLKIIHANFNQNSKLKKDEKFKKVVETYQKFIDNNILIKEDKPSFYIYQQTHKNRKHRGIICLSSVQDYIRHKIKIHEETITFREQAFAKYLDACKFHAEPIFLTYPKQKDIEKIIEKYTLQTPEYDFCTSDTIKHELWVVQKKQDIETVQNSFKNINALYMADGHHRSASSRIFYENNKENPKAKYVLSYLINEENLQIFPFHRAIKSLGKYDYNTFLNAITHFFHIKSIEKYQAPTNNETFGLYMDSKWYLLSLKKGIFKEKLISTKILSETIFKHILNIQDLKKSKNIDFQEGIQPIESITKIIDKKKYKVLITHFPITIEQIKKIADDKKTMPPKSTWIEPKMRIGLSIYDMN